jgi:hypothetical protein
MLETLYNQYAKSGTVQLYETAHSAGECSYGHTGHCTTQPQRMFRGFTPGMSRRLCFGHAVKFAKRHGMPAPEDKGN